MYPDLHQVAEMVQFLLVSDKLLPATNHLPTFETLVKAVLQENHNEPVLNLLS